MESINKILSDYMQAMEDKRNAEKRAGELKEMILQHAGDNDMILTDEYSAIIQRKTSTRIDTKKLYADFTETAIKREYGIVSTSTTVIISARENNGEKSA